MKVLIIEDMEEYDKKVNQYIRDVADDKRPIDPKMARKKLVMTPEVFVKVFSPQRLKLIMRIKKNKINSIYELAKDLGRKYEAVHRDIKYLEGFGIIKIKKRKHRRIPYIAEPIKVGQIA